MKTILLYLFVSLFLTNCKKRDEISNVIPDTNFFVKATVDGKEYYYEDGGSYLTDKGFGIVGNNGSNNSYVGFYTVGTISFKPESLSIGTGGFAKEQDMMGAYTYATKSGSCTISKCENRIVEGTFQFSYVYNGKSITVTKGSFRRNLP